MRDVPSDGRRGGTLSQHTTSERSVAGTWPVVALCTSCDAMRAMRARPTRAMRLRQRERMVIGEGASGESI